MASATIAAARMPWWAWAWPALCWALLAMAAAFPKGGLLTAALGIALIATVFAAVYHAEVVAHRVGEPFGTLILAFAVTVIEVALVAQELRAGLPRDVLHDDEVLVLALVEAEVEHLDDVGVDQARRGQGLAA